MSNEEQNMSELHHSTFLQSAFNGSLARPINIYESVKLLRLNKAIELPTVLLKKLALKIMTLDDLNFKCSKSLNEGYVICEPIN